MYSFGIALEPIVVAASVVKARFLPLLEESPLRLSTEEVDRIHAPIRSPLPYGGRPNNEVYSFCLVSQVAAVVLWISRGCFIVQAR